MPGGRPWWEKSLVLSSVSVKWEWKCGPWGTVVKKNNDVCDRPQTVSEQHVLSTLEVIVDVIATAVILIVIPIVIIIIKIDIK